MDRKAVHYILPSFKKKEFNCHNCGVFTHQYWSDCRYDDNNNITRTLSDLNLAVCGKCKVISYWLKGKRIYPIIEKDSTIPEPFDDMPEDVKEEFLEAREVLDESPRSAAALLRLALQKLMPHVGEKGENINADIASLVKKGLLEPVQKSLDVLRVIGNEAVHPGQMDLKDDIGTATSLFDLLNFIVDELITKPKRIADIYDKLPKSKKEAINMRDKS